MTQAFARISAFILSTLYMGGCTIIPVADPSRSYVTSPTASSTPVVRTKPSVQSTPHAVEAPTETTSSTGSAWQPPLTYATLGQTVTVDAPRITPLEVLEDSRCPINARCVWGGQVRLRVKIETGKGGFIEVISGKPVHVADGTLELVDVQPGKLAGSIKQTASNAPPYRFGFRFIGGY